MWLVGEDLTPLIEEQLRSFDFDSPEKFDETNSTPLHLLVSEQPPLHVVNMMLAADRGQASLPNDDGCFPLELAVSYGASLDVIMAIAEAFPPALEKNSMKLNPPTCLYSSSPTSTLTTSFYSPIPFCEVVNVVKKRDFASLGSNLRRYLSIEKRMEAMVLIRCMIRKEDSQQPQTEGQIEEIYRNPLLRGVGFNHNNELR